MEKFEALLRGMTFDFFGGGKHKIEMEALFATPGAILLDVRSRPEQESVQIRLEHHLRVLWIPVEELPDRHAEIPRDATVGIFCTSGTRSTLAYAFLRMLGHERARITPAGYDAVTAPLMPGKLFKAMKAAGAAPKTA